MIIQNDVGNQYSPTTIIAPITSGEKEVYLVKMFVAAPEGGLDNNSLVLLNQIRAVDKRRLVRYLGKLNSKTMRKVDRAITISLGLVSI